MLLLCICPVTRTPQVPVIIPAEQSAVFFFGSMAAIKTLKIHSNLIVSDKVLKKTKCWDDIVNMGNEFGED